MASLEDCPNIIIFLADEMRGNTLSLEGRVNSTIKTPNLDNLANEGVAFTNAFTASPYCVPSRCATFTGQFVHSNAHRSMYQMLEPYEENLFKFLKQKGYEVVWMGRNDLFTKEAINESVTNHFSMYSGAKILRKLISGRKKNPFSSYTFAGTSIYLLSLFQ